MFEPIGEKSRREVVLDVFKGKPEDATVTYEELSEALGGVDRAIVQATIHAAKRGLLRDQNKAIEAIRGIGYRVVEAGEHIRLAGGQQKKSSRALVRSKNTVEFTDLNGLTEDQRSALHHAGRAIGYLLTEQRRLNIRQGNLERSLDSVVTRQDRTDEETRALKERMERLEKAVAEGA